MLKQLQHQPSIIFPLLPPRIDTIITLFNWSQQLIELPLSGLPSLPEQ